MKIKNRIRNWMRNRNILELLGAWDMEFDTFMYEVGANRFNMTLANGM